MSTIIFDIETGPRPERELAELFQPLAPEDIKTGNVRDPVKVQEKITAAQAQHRADFFDNAALSAVTGRVLAIGYAADDDKPPTVDCDDNEAALLGRFWASWQENKGARWVGFNILRFDLPFIIRRSWALKVPTGYVRRGRYWADNLVDLREVWQLGDYQAHGSLDVVAKLLGVGAKTGNGAHFAALLQSDRAAALDYLRNDVAITRAVFRRMNLG